MSILKSNPKCLLLKNLSLPLLLLALVLIIYSRALLCGFINFDDPVYVSENLIVLSGLNLQSVLWAFTTNVGGNWHPVTWISHLVAAQFFGAAPWGHHLFNVAIHAANVLLLYFLIVACTGSRWRSGAVSALFALHPLHVETVLWISERKGLLSSFFWFSAMLAYVSFTRQKTVKRYFLVLLLFMGGLLSKPMVVTLPLVLLIIDRWPLGRTCGENGASWFFLIREKMPLFLMSGIFAAIAISTQVSVGAVSAISAVDVTKDIGNALTAYIRYLGKMFFPVDLGILYPLQPEYLTPVKLISACAFLVLCTWVTFHYRNRHPVLLAGWAWYVVTLLPVVGVMRIGSQAIADRYTYIPLIGIYLAIIWCASDFTARKEVPRIILVIVITLIVIILMVLTWRQEAYWNDSISLYRHTLSFTKNNWLIHNNLASAYLAKGNIGEAYEQAVTSLKINPSNGEAFDNLGVIQEYLGEKEDAVRSYREALRLNPRLYSALANLILVYAALGEFSEAVAEYQLLVEGNPVLAGEVYTALPTMVKERLPNKPSLFSRPGDAN